MTLLGLFRVVGVCNIMNGDPGTIAIADLKDSLPPYAACKVFGQVCVSLQKWVLFLFTSPSVKRDE